MEQPRSEADAATAAGARASALPVAVRLEEPAAATVRAWCEGTLGWQVVDDDGTDPVPPVVRLVDHRAGGVGGSGRDTSEVPTVLLLGEDLDAVVAAEAARRLRPAAVLRWPSERDTLPARVEQLVVAGRSRRGNVPCLLVGGSAGGVGTTTVALAMAGLRAWTGTPTLVGVRGRGLSPRAVPTAALGAADLWAAGDPCPGVPGLRAVRLADHGQLPEMTDPSVGALVVDAGVDAEVDVLVCRLDRAGAEALEGTGAAAIVVVGATLLPQRTVRSLLAGRPAVTLPWSARVARAGLRDRVPADLPGSFLDRLRVVASGQVRPGVDLRAGPSSRSERVRAGVP